ncbi:MAG: S8 family serine peptidase [Planctomycetota bacterium]|jgi:serine protease AprX
MIRETNFSIVILTGLFVFLNVFAVVLAQQQEIEEPIIIESNNIVFSVEDTAEEKVSGKNEVQLRTVGKVESIVEEESKTKELLNVIVYVQVPGVEDAAGKAKAPFESEIESISDRIRQIDLKSRPEGPMSPDYEKLAVLAQEFMRTEQERQQLSDLRMELDTKMDEKRRAVGAETKKTAKPVLNAVAAFITANGGKVGARVNIVSALGASIPSAFLEELAAHPLVLSVMKDRPTEYELDVSIPSVDYDTWWNDGYDGGAFDFGIVDDGVQDDHPAFAGITFYEKSGSSILGSHGTHVTGIAASGDATYRGGAYGLDAIIWANAGSSYDVLAAQATTMDNMEWLASGAAQGPEVVNHSLGYGTADDTDYSDNDSFYDAYVSYYDIMVTKSCGNGYWDDTDPTITHPAPSYNLMAVANIDDKNTLTRSDDVRKSSSSVGPTLNGRKKPDITAPGSFIMSTYAYWSGSNPDFVSKSGTSMSAPHVAAAIILMEDAGNHTPMAQKAVLINTADAWTSNDTSSTADDGSVTGSHWDKSYGWGYIDMWEAHYNRGDYFVDSVVPNNGNSTPDDYELYKGYMFIDEKATMVWEKRSNYVAGDPPTVKYSLSDLNIRLYNEADNSLVDYDFDVDDNVHQVAANIAGTMVIKAYANTSSFSGATSESFALATEENFVRAAPPAFSISLTMPPAVVSNTVFTVTANVQNTGDVKSHNNMVTLTIPGGFTIVTGANPQNIGIISAGATGQATWTVRASSTSGNYTISASNSSNCYIETYTGSGSGSIIVDPTHTPLSNDSPVVYSAIPKDFSFSLVDYDWCCIGINPAPGDHDIKADDNSDLLSPYQNSSYIGTTRDFVVTNGHQAAWGAPTVHYAQVHYGTASSYTIEVEWSVPDLVVGNGYSDVMPSNHVFQMYEIYLTNGQIYELTVDITSGSTDVAVYVFKPTRSHGRRAVYDWVSNSGGAGIDESLVFTADSTGYYGIAVINDNALSADYTITVDKYIQPLLNDTPATFSAIPKDFSFQVVNYDWCGVGINPAPSDHDIIVDNNSVLTTPYASSTYIGTTRDFTVTNGHNWGSVEHYARVYYGSPSSYVIEAEWEAFDIVVNNSYLDAIGSGEVIQIYEGYLTGGRHYQLTMDITSGDADVAVYMYKPTRAQGSRWEYDKMANVQGPGGDEYLCFTADTTGYYGFAVINENAGASDYTIAVRTACTRDIFADGINNLKDLALILLRWLEGCRGPDWCGCADLDQSGKIDNGDVRIVAEEWLTVFKWFDRLTAADIAAMDHTLSGDSIDASDGSEFWPGTYFVYKTNLGRYGKFIVDDLDQADNNKLTISWVTYEPDGSIYSQGSGLEINGTWTCDLDKGVEGPSAGAEDWQWLMQTGTTRFLSPRNGAEFKLMYRATR